MSNSVSEAFMLTPSEIAYVCQGQQLILKCETSANFLQWNITFTDSGYNDERYIISSATADITPLRVNDILFEFTRISEAPLVTTITISNVIADLKIDCIEYYAEQSTSILSTLILLVRAQDRNGNYKNL
jgi:hypothetical protein